MSFGIHGDVKRVSETRYPGRVREVALNQERADDQERLAQLEDYVRRHKKQPPAPQDSVEVKSTPPNGEAEKPPAPDAKSAEKKPATPREGDHIDITL